MTSTLSRRLPRKDLPQTLHHQCLQPLHSLNSKNPFLRAPPLSSSLLFVLTCQQFFYTIGTFNPLFPSLFIVSQLHDLLCSLYTWVKFHSQSFSSPPNIDTQFPCPSESLLDLFDKTASLDKITYTPSHCIIKEHNERKAQLTSWYHSELITITPHPAFNNTQQPDYNSLVH